MKGWVDFRVTQWFWTLYSLGSKIQRLNHQAIAPFYMSKHCSILLIYSWSNRFIFCTIHFSFTQLYEMPLLFWNNWAKQKWFFVTFRTKKSSQVTWFNSTSIFQRLLLFRTEMFGHLFSMLCFSWNVNIAHFMEHQ